MLAVTNDSLQFLHLKKLGKKGRFQVLFNNIN